MDSQPTEQNQTPEDYSLSEPRLAGRVEGPKPSKKIISAIPVILAILALIGGAYYYFTRSNQIACTMEAKQCPDGSYVGRTGQNCEFAECPQANNETASWQTYLNEEYGFEVKYPINLTISTDIPPKPTGTVARVRLQKNTLNTNITISVFNNLKQLSVREWLIQEGAEPSFTDTQFNSYTAVKLDKNDSSSYFICIGKAEYIYMIDVVKNQLDGINDQILSTFKFTK